MSRIEIHRPQLPALTSIRFFAAFAVLLYHLTATGLLAWPKAVTSQGFIGVSFFFVLSGFILVYSHADLPFDTGRFFRLRFARIYPTLAFSLIVSLPLLLSMGRQSAMYAWATDHFKLTTTACLLLIQAWLPMSALAWSGVAWSLSVEAFFYFLFPVLLKRLARVGVRNLIGIVAGCWLINVAMSTIYLVLRPDGSVALGDGSPIPYFWKATLKYNPVVHLPEFVAGMACAFIFLRGVLPISRRALLVGSGAAAVILVLLLRQRIPYLVIHTGLLAPAFASIILGLAMRPRWLGWLEHRFLVALGNASYSLYLLHATVMIYVFLMMRKPFNLVTGLAYIGGMVVFSLLVFRFLEEPARRWLSPLPRVRLVDCPGRI
jgi:peptidoglycan/LPS O-acetylase OafA/YrhL